MEERSRLGRGLQEISRLYLSDTPREDAGEKEPGSAAEDTNPGAGPGLLCEASREESAPGLSIGSVREEGLKGHRRVIRVIHPGSPIEGAFFTANFSLELARHRHRVEIWDGTVPEGVEAMLRQVVFPDPDAEALSVKLYGLPDITLYRAGPHGGEKLAELVCAVGVTDEARWLIIDTPHCLEDVVEGPADFDAILLSTVEFSSLLQCYAYVKVLRQQDPERRISLVFIDPGSEEQAREVFSSFSAFAKGRLGACVDYLGRLIRDEFMDRSISTHTPLVLGHEPSVARESLTAVIRAFLQQRRALCAGQ